MSATHQFYFNPFFYDLQKHLDVEQNSRTRFLINKTTARNPYGISS